LIFIRRNERNPAGTPSAYRRAIEGPDLVLSKGQGNFETAPEIPVNLCCLLKARCEGVAAGLGIGYGGIVFPHRRRKL
jgi:uncharacterized protein with ATP-grasp and redox domains